MLTKWKTKLDLFDCGAIVIRTLQWRQPVSDDAVRGSMIVEVKGRPSYSQFIFVLKAFCDFAAQRKDIFKGDANTLTKYLIAAERKALCWCAVSQSNGVKQWDSYAELWRTESVVDNDAKIRAAERATQSKSGGEAIGNADRVYKRGSRKVRIHHCCPSTTSSSCRHVVVRLPSGAGLSDPSPSEIDSAESSAGAAVAELLARSPPTKANRVQSPAGSSDFRIWESCRAMPLVGGPSRGSPTAPAPSFRLLRSRNSRKRLFITILDHCSVNTATQLMARNAVLSPRNPHVVRKPTHRSPPLNKENRARIRTFAKTPGLGEGVRDGVALRGFAARNIFADITIQVKTAAAANRKGAFKKLLRALRPCSCVMLRDRCLLVEVKGGRDAFPDDVMPPPPQDRTVVGVSGRGGSSTARPLHLKARCSVWRELWLSAVQTFAPGESPLALIAAESLRKCSLAGSCAVPKQTNHSDECYFRIVNVIGINRNNYSKWTYPGLLSARQPVPHSDDSPIPSFCLCHLPELQEDEFCVSDAINYSETKDSDNEFVET
ncbi:hypothetical protein PR048_009576 [Dryococelus australis]|uniref:Uncharacterized protein n=1 Tax=Dryococelus australis TaxID=614101 RepID=A0ABQ9I0B6_9NEOP|nr:hypothetical protein PR048_009576 [Dryococelus australis]